MSVHKQYQFLKETEREQYFSILLGFLHTVYPYSHNLKIICNIN
jgi:hypothetical protein